MLTLTIGQKIKALRIRLHVTQKKFVEGLGITPQYLCEIEKEKKRPSTTLMMLIENRYSISLSDERPAEAGDMRISDKPPATGPARPTGPYVGEPQPVYAVVKRFPPELQPFIDTLIEVMQSGDEVIAAALKQNLEAFREAVQRGRQIGIASKKERAKAGEK